MKRKQSIIGLVDILQTILENNKPALSAEAHFLQKYHIRSIMKYIKENEPDAEIIKILRKICITNGIPIRNNQLIIYREFIKKHEKKEEKKKRKVEYRKEKSIEQGKGKGEKGEKGEKREKEKEIKAEVKKKHR